MQATYQSNNSGWLNLGEDVAQYVNHGQAEDLFLYKTEGKYTVRFRGCTWARDLQRHQVKAHIATALATLEAPLAPRRKSTTVRGVAID